MQAIKFFTIDLAEIRGRGEFKCPRCGSKISPEDETEDAYTILRPVMKGDSLERIILQCNRCQSQLHLTGFDLIDRIR